MRTINEVPEGTTPCSTVTVRIGSIAITAVLSAATHLLNTTAINIAKSRIGYLIKL
jgi:hypothetical protein